MKFRHVTGKLANMRKSVEWTLCPGSEDRPDEFIIQSEKRIARYNRATGKVVVSTGKNGHNGFMHLSPALGAVEIDAPEWLVTQIANLEEDHGPNDTGEVVVMDGNGNIPQTVHARTDGPVSIFDL